MSVPGGPRHLPVLSTGLGPGGIEVAGAAGVWFRLADGRRVIDASNTAAPLGHCHPDLVAAVRGASGSPALSEGWVWPGRQQAADDLLEHAFSGEEGWVGAVRFFTSASEANDQALSLAQALTGRAPLVTRERAYHGMAGLSREMNVQPQWHRRAAGGAGGAGVLWIAEEVVTGLGRQGRWMTFQGGASRPDIVTLGEGLAGGVAPAGAVVLSQRVAGMLAGQLWQTCGTFRGHPLTVAAISATVRRIGREGLVERAESLGATLRARLARVAAAHPCVLRVDGLGLHWTLELHGGDWRNWHGDTSEPTPADHIVAAALDAGVLIAASSEETSLFIAPPLIVSDEELGTILRVLDRALSVADGRLPLVTPLTY